MLKIKKQLRYQKPTLLAGLFIVSMIGSAGILNAIDPMADTTDRNVKISSTESRHAEKPNTAQIESTESTNEKVPSTTAPLPVVASGGNEYTQQVAASSHEPSSQTPRPSNEAATNQNSQSEPAPQTVEEQPEKKSLLDKLIPVSLVGL